MALNQILSDSLAVEDIGFLTVFLEAVFLSLLSTTGLLSVSRITLFNVV